MLKNNAEKRKTIELKFFQNKNFSKLHPKHRNITNSKKGSGGLQNVTF